MEILNLIDTAPSARNELLQYAGTVVELTDTEAAPIGAPALDREAFDAAARPLVGIHKTGVFRIPDASQVIAAFEQRMANGKVAEVSEGTSTA